MTRKSSLIVTLLIGACNNPPATNGGSDAAVSVDLSAGADLAVAQGGCSVTGTFGGNGLSAKDCITLAVTLNGTTTTDLLVTDFANDCAFVMAHPNSLKASSNILDFHFITTGAVTAGTYTPGSPQLDVQYAQYDATCNSPDGESASGGTVTVTKADGSGIYGTFDLTFNTDHVTGAFSAPNCNVSAIDGGGAACQ